MKCPEQQIHRDRKQITGCQGLGERGCVGRYRISFWGDENVLMVLMVVMVTQQCKYTKNLML